MGSFVKSSTGNSLFIKFQSDEVLSYDGFHATIQYGNPYLQGGGTIFIKGAHLIRKMRFGKFSKILDLKSPILRGALCLLAPLGPPPLHIWISNYRLSFVRFLRANFEKICQNLIASISQMRDYTCLILAITRTFSKKGLVDRKYLRNERYHIYVHLTRVLMWINEFWIRGKSQGRLLYRRVKFFMAP